ncbi:MAG: hypothetical protein KYX69_10245 [Sphingomonas sp.]|uniref:hypothetical protein n=1 Tax=Sphingomonas sp. TaxID=28214 RepID=UPI0026107BDF|nr:hypothetical protein [Sphingomonas sp.]MDK2768082.1 hypothetical protein [Sphingomonas sp.]
MRAVLLATAALALTGCAGQGKATDPQDSFMRAIAAHCGKAYAGRVVTTDAADASFASQALVMHVAACESDRVRIPFHVGEDRSRTWVLTRTATGVRLKHDHRHQDGTSDVLTMYGGDTATPGTPERQEFPVDADSSALFRANDRAVSVTNVWAMEVTPTRFAYELRRPGRHFRVEFDLTQPIATPPMPWGWQD